MTEALACLRPTLAGDLFSGLTDMHRAVRSGFRLPNNVSDLEYVDLKQKAKIERSPLICAVGFGLSFGGKWFAGITRPDTKYTKQFNKWADRFQKQQNIFLREDSVSFLSWREFARPGVTFYCDPPYVQTTNYATGVWNPEFLIQEAWAWKALGARVFISEFSQLPGTSIVFSFTRNFPPLDGTQKATQQTELLLELTPQA